MVRMPMAVKPIENLAEALRSAYPELDAVRVATDAPVYLVGGAVRDLLLGRGRSDIDLVVVGDAATLAAKLGAEPVEHERFATAKARLDGHEVDIASARAESYPRPGALPEVEPASDIETDLGRRDFTINAIAIPLRGEPRLIDPYGGRADLDAGLLRVLHPLSLADDPTRALRAARYAARFGFQPEPETARLLRAVDLGTVSNDRKRAELLLIASEPAAPRAFELLSEWGLINLREGGVELAERTRDLLSSPLWIDEVQHAPTILAAALGPPGEEVELAAQRPKKPSHAVELASGRHPQILAIARAMGAEWLDDYLSEWRGVVLDIDGSTLIAAGIPEGPALGRGLRAAWWAKLDGETSSWDDELRVALAAAISNEDDR